MTFGIVGFIFLFLFSPFLNLVTNAYQNTPISIKICHERGTTNLRLAFSCNRNEDDLINQLIGPEGPKGETGLGYADTFSSTENEIKKVI